MADSRWQFFFIDIRYPISDIRYPARLPTQTPEHYNILKPFYVNSIQNSPARPGVVELVVWSRRKTHLYLRPRLVVTYRRGAQTAVLQAREPAARSGLFPFY